MLLEILGAVLQAVGILRRVGARSPQNCASARQDSAHRREIEFHGFVFQQTAPALHKSNESIFIVKAALAHHSSNDRIQSRTIAPARQYSNFHDLLLI